MTSAAYFRALSILHLALMLGVALFSIISFILIYTGSFPPVDEATGKIFSIVAAVVALIMVVVSKIVFKKKMLLVNAENDLQNKLNQYRAALIVQYAMLEFPALFAVIAALLSGNKILLLLVIGLLAIMFAQRPTLSKALSELDLTDQESIKLEDPDQVLSDDLSM